MKNGEGNGFFLNFRNPKLERNNMGEKVCLQVRNTRTYVKEIGTCGSIVKSIWYDWEGGWSYKSETWINSWLFSFGGSMP